MADTTTRTLAMTTNKDGSNLSTISEINVTARHDDKEATKE
jgi:hypothetical protein